MAVHHLEGILRDQISKCVHAHWYCVRAISNRMITLTREAIALLLLSIALLRTVLT
jgi:hypothetical protein